MVMRGVPSQKLRNCWVSDPAVCDNLFPAPRLRACLSGNAGNGAPLAIVADCSEGPLRVCAVTRRRFPVGASPTRQPLQPEATGAVMEVTKWLKPSGSGSRIGDRASVQAATRVNAEQASHDEGLVKGSHHGNIETRQVDS